MTTRTVQRHGRLVPSGSVVERLGDPDYVLHVDGAEIGRISTDKLDDTLQEDVNRGFLLRRTRVSFADTDVTWRIAAVIPEPEQVSDQLRGKRWIAQKTLALRVLNRKLILVEEPAGVDAAADRSRRLAGTRGMFGGSGTGRKAEVVVAAGGREYPLSPARERKRGKMAPEVSIRRRNPVPSAMWASPWTVQARSPVPLGAVLLYWHILMGDVSELGGGGVAG